MSKRNFSIKGAFYRLIHHKERATTLKFCHLDYCKKRQQEVCVMQLIGKNSFPTFTPHEILKSPDILRTISSEDAVIIAQLDTKIRLQNKQCRILEFDRNGTFLLKDGKGKLERFAEDLVSQNKALIEKLDSFSAYKLGVKLGIKQAKKSQKAFLPKTTKPLKL